jgi:hypothetical protein
VPRPGNQLTYGGTYLISAEALSRHHLQKTNEDLRLDHRADQIYQIQLKQIETRANFSIEQSRPVLVLNTEQNASLCVDCCRRR